MNKEKSLRRNKTTELIQIRIGAFLNTMWLQPIVLTFQREARKGLKPLVMRIRLLRIGNARNDSLVKVAHAVCLQQRR